MPAKTEQSPESYPPTEENGNSRVHLRVQLAPGTRLRVTIDSLNPEGRLVSTEQIVYTGPKTAPSGGFGLSYFFQFVPRLGRFGRSLGSAGWLFLLAVVVYLFVRLYALADYPIYFFTDEAVQTILAADFVRDGFRNYARDFLPTYFLNVYQYNLGVSVYLQVIPTLLFGRSLEVTRGVSVLVSLIPAISVGLILKNSFGSRYPWLATLLLSVTPAWFLHSRTAFETSLAVSFYAGFLYFYLRYRQGSLRSIYWAITFAGLCFYSYSPAQMVLAVTAALLFFSDLRYHWQQRLTLIKAFGLILIFSLPYLRFQILHPGEGFKHLAQIGSYWVGPFSVLEKMVFYFREYFAGLNPLYWFPANTLDLPRHTMDGYGHLLWYTFPLFFFGLYLVLRRWRSPAHRALLITLIAAPGGAALVGMGITRALFMVIPAALLSSLALSFGLDWLVRRRPAVTRTLSLAFWLLLGGLNIVLLGDALTRGPTWSTNYGLSGMQYGARQVYTEIKQILKEKPETKIMLSTSWANGADIVARFFMNDPVPISLGSVDTYLQEKQPLDANNLFIIPPEEYQRAIDSGKMTGFQTEATLPWPDGRAGFYFVRMRYVENVEEVFKSELVEKYAMLEDKLTTGNDTFLVKFSRPDMGGIKHVFDGNLDTLMRSMAANPLKIQVDFSAPRRMNGLNLQIGGTATTLDVAVQVLGENQARTFHKVIPETTVTHLVDVQFGANLEVAALFIQVKNTFDQEPAHVHLWEIIFK